MVVIAIEVVVVVAVVSVIVVVALLAVIVVVVVFAMVGILVVEWWVLLWFSGCHGCRDFYPAESVL